MATANHICLGSVFAWSLFNQPLMRLLGVVAPASADWLLGDVTTTFSLVMGGFGWGAVFSKYLDRLGPRLCGIIGAASLGGGFSLAALAVHFHSLPLLWLGGGIWGIAMPPVANLMKWFPTHKGFAAGVVVVGYGSGALVAAPLFQYLLKEYQRAPTYLGPTEKIQLTADSNGRLFAETLDGVKEVVVATLNDVNTTFNGSIDPGVYIVGSGSTGVSEAFLTLGTLYTITMLSSALSYRQPPNLASPAIQQLDNIIEAQPKTDLSIYEATRTKQFGFLYFGFVFASSGAYALISCSKLMLSTSFPTLSSAALTTFVAGTSIANLSGRLFYSSFSDYLSKNSPFYGRRLVYTMMWGFASPLGYAGILSAIHLNSNPNVPEQARVALFCASTFLVLSSFGGSAATRPAIVSDLFGVTNTAALTARQLSGVLPAALLGPRMVAYFSEQANRTELAKLVELVDEEKFKAAFGGASKSNLNSLIDTKTVTIPRVLELCPPGTIDPSSFVFDNALLCAAALTGSAFVCNRLTKPLHNR